MRNAVFVSVLSWQVGDLVSDLVIYPAWVQYLNVPAQAQLEPGRGGD